MRCTPPASLRISSARHGTSRYLGACRPSHMLRAKSQLAQGWTVEVISSFRFADSSMRIER